MRRLLSILLVLAFGLPFATPLFALGADSDAPVMECCRRNGAHHCTLSAAEKAELASKTPQWRAPQMRCPYGPAVVTGVRVQNAAPAAAQAIYAGLVAHPAVFAQTERKLQIAEMRSRQKRGPPALFSL